MTTPASPSPVMGIPITATDPPPATLTTAEVAGRYGVTPAWVTTEARRGRLAGERTGPGKGHFFTAAAVEAWAAGSSYLKAIAASRQRPAAPVVEFKINDPRQPAADSND